MPDVSAYDSVSRDSTWTSWLDVYRDFDSRGNDCTESCSLHPYTRLDLPAHRDDLGTNMFSLSIAIRPDHQQISVSSFRMEIAFDRLVVLHAS